MMPSRSESNNSKNKINGLEYSLTKFKCDFDNRHDFESEDLQVLKSKFPNVQFENIPEAWVIPIDQMLSKIGDKTRCVVQNFGFLSVLLDANLSDEEYTKLRKVIYHCEHILYDIDRDLHDKLGLT